MGKFLVSTALGIAALVPLQVFAGSTPPVGTPTTSAFVPTISVGPTAATSSTSASSGGVFSPIVVAPSGDGGLSFSLSRPSGGVDASGTGDNGGLGIGGGEVNAEADQ